MFTLALMYLTGALATGLNDFVQQYRTPMPPRWYDYALTGLAWPTVFWRLWKIYRGK